MLTRRRDTTAVAELGEPQEHAARHLTALGGREATTLSAVRAIAEATPPVSR